MTRYKKAYAKLDLALKLLGKCCIISAMDLFMNKHFNVTVYIINNNKFLMIKHKKLKKWLPAGGHIEQNESPDEAALREVEEETGLSVELVGERFPRQTDCIRPYGIQLNVIKENEHVHMDLIYLARPKDSNNVSLILNKDETDDIGWFSIDQILEPSFDSFQETKQWCKKFYDMIS